MNFYCCSIHKPDEYKEFILSHENAVKTEKAAWMPLPEPPKEG